MSAAVRWRGTAVVLLLGALAEILVAHEWPGPVWTTVPLAAVCLLALALVPSRPFVAVVLVCAGLLTAILVLGRPQTIVGLLAVLIAGYVTGAHLRGPRRWVALVLVLVTPAVAVAHVRPGDAAPDAVGIVLAVLLYTVPFGLGALLRSRAAASAAATSAAEAAEERQRLLAELAVRDERDRIARELQTVVTDAVRTVVTAAERGRGAVRERPDDADAAFETAVRTGQHALAEMRRLLGVLRTAGDDPATAPQPTLAGLGALLASVAAAGLPVRLVVGDDARALPDTVELTAYRIVERVLGGLLEAGPAERATVALAYGAALEVAVDVVPAGLLTDGVVAAVARRAAAAGGSAVLEPAADGGARVRADLPLVAA